MASKWEEHGDCPIGSGLCWRKNLSNSRLFNVRWQNRIISTGRLIPVPLRIEIPESAASVLNVNQLQEIVDRAERATERFKVLEHEAEQLFSQSDRARLNYLLKRKDSRELLPCEDRELIQLSARRARAMATADIGAQRAYDCDK